MDGFQKIDLVDKPLEKEDMPKRKRAAIRNRKDLKKTLGIAAIIAVLLIVVVLFAVVLPLLRVEKSAKKTMAQARLVQAAIKTQNIEEASVELEKTKTELAQTQKDLHAVSFLHFIPIANFYYNDADHLVNAGMKGLGTAGIVVESLKPYADVLGLKGQGSFTMGSAEDRIKTAVLTMGKITPQIDQIATSLQEIKTDIDAVNPNHYPEFIFGKKIKSQLKEARDLTDQGVLFVDQARPLIKVLPSLLGESEEKRYLVLFQNDKELRPTGGFITAYAIFKIDKGVISIERSDDIYALDNSIPNKPEAPRPILRYLPKVYTFNLRDSNLSPDYIESMKTFRELYDRATQSVPVDGIIAIDTNVLVSTIKILDDQVTAGGITFTTQNDSRCDCPQVIYELEDNISRPVNYIKTERKALLGQLLQALMQKALSSSPKLYWGPLFQSMLMQTNQKHVLFDLFDKDAQSGIEALNAAGRIKTFEGDYLHINDTNFAGAKSNLFVTEDVENRYNIDNDGTITKTLNITWKNSHPPSDCNLERGALCLNAELRDWLRIYVPKGSQLVSSKGSQVKMTSYDELGKTVFEGFVTVPTQGKAIFTITYKLPFKLEKGSNLPVLIQKQPGTNGNGYTMFVNDKQRDTFQLFADKEYSLKI